MKRLVLLATCLWTINVAGCHQKLECGYKEVLVEENCQEDFNVCHAGLKCISGPCESCKNIRRATCAEEYLGQEAEYGSAHSKFVCCASCPSSCNKSNDFPCKENTTPNLTNACFDQLPMCQN